MRLAVALAALTAACGHAGTAPVDEPPTPVTPPADAAPPSPADAADDAAIGIAPDVPADAATDAHRAPPPGGGSGYRVDRVLKGTITASQESFIEITFEQPVKKRSAGNLWDEVANRPVPGSAFLIGGVRSNGAGGSVAGARLPRALSSYGDYTTVRVVERYDDH